MDCNLVNLLYFTPGMIWIVLYFIRQACKNGLVQHLEHLLYYGAEIDARTATGNTALHVAALNNQVTQPWTPLVSEDQHQNSPYRRLKMCLVQVYESQDLWINMKLIDLMLCCVTRCGSTEVESVTS